MIAGPCRGDRWLLALKLMVSVSTHWPERITYVLRGRTRAFPIPRTGKRHTGPARPPHCNGSCAPSYSPA
jgi:hypothetical protein